MMPAGITTRFRKAGVLVMAAGLMLRSRIARPARSPRIEYGRVFIGGSARSGNTWVQEMFAAHPRVVSNGGEAHAWEDVFTPLHRSGRGLAGWARLLWVDAENRRKGSVVRFWRWIDRRTFRRLVCWAMAEPGTADEMAEELISAIFDHYVATNAAHERPVLVEKTPANIFWAERILALYPDARFVEVRRDGRDVVVSMQKLAHRGGAWTKDRLGLIEAWASAVESGIALREHDELAGRVLVVRYEDLKADPVEGIRQLWDLAGLEHEPGQVEAAARDTSFEAGKARKGAGEGRFRRKGVVGDWVGNLDEKDLDLIRQAAGDTFAAAGYSL